MISAGSAFAASDAAADVSDADIVAIADVSTSNEENNDLNNELTENNAILKAADDLNETTLIVENDTAYQIPKVLEGEAYYHIALFSNDSAVVGRTIFVDFDGDISNVTTSIYGDAIYKIPKVDQPGKYPIKVDFAGDDVYAPSTATAQVELLEVVTEIKPLINITEYPRIAVKENLGYFPFVFIAAVGENETELLGDKLLFVTFDDEYTVECITDEFGIGAFLIPNNTRAGQHFINITYESGDGYTGSSFATEIEIYNLETQIIAFKNMSYSRPAVIEGNALYPILLTTNKTTIPIPLANATVKVRFNNGDVEEFTTNSLGYINYTIPASAFEGNYSMEIIYDGEDGYEYSELFANIEVYFIETQIIAFKNHSYPRPVVVHGDAWYPILLATNTSITINGTEYNIPIPIANKTISIEFEDYSVELTTNSFGYVNITLPADTPAGNHTMKIVYDGEDGYTFTAFETTVEVYDVPTKIIALGNASYPRPLVVAGYGYYPIMLVSETNISLGNETITVPFPLANKKVSVDFLGIVEEFTTDEFGLINLTIATDVTPGNYTGTFSYDGEADGYIGTDLTVTIEVYDVPTKIYALDNVAYPAPLVAAGYGLYPIALTTDTYVNISGKEYLIPIPLGNKTVSVTVDGETDEFETDEFGIIMLVIDPEVGEGNYTVEISFVPGEDDEGYIGSDFTGNIEIYDIPTEIHALENMSYPRPLVIEGYGYYPIVLTTDILVPIAMNFTLNITDNWTIPVDINTTIPVHYPLANKTVTVDFDGAVYEFITNDFGLINYIIDPEVAPGNYTVTISYAGSDGFAPADFTTNVEVYDMPTMITAIDGLAYPRALVINDLAFFPLALTTDTYTVINGTEYIIPIPLANKTVLIGLDDGELAEFTTDELGVIIYTLPFEAYTGDHTVVMVYEGDEGYVPSSLNVTVEIFDVDTQIFALDNMSYPAPLVAAGLAYYPIGLTTDIPIPVVVNYTLNITENCSIPIVINTTIPVDIPIANKTVHIFFNGEEEEFTTNDLGIINYFIPVDTVAGNYTVEMIFAGTDGYRDSKLVTNVEVYDIPTLITAIDGLAYPRALVINDLAFFPLALTTDTYTVINGTEYIIPIPLANKTVLIGLDDGELAEFTTDELGVIIYTLPFEAYTGDHTVVMVYEGDEGYVPSSLNVTVEIFDVDTQIFALDNMSYPAPLVAAGLAYYPIGLTTDIPIPVVVNYTLNITENCSIPIVINTTIPVDIPIANKTVHIFFNGEEEEFTTNDLGIINYFIPVDTVAGNYTVEMIFAGTDGYRDSKLVTNVEVYDIPTVITSLGNLSYPTPVVLEGLGYYPILLTTNISFTINGTVIPIPLPLANKTLTVDFNGVSEELMTNEYGIAYYVIPTTTTAGNYTIDIAFAGEEGIYAPTSLTTDVEIYDIESVFIAPDNITFEAADVTSGFAKIPIFLATNTTVPIPLINKTVLVNFNDQFEVYTTSWLGMVVYTVPENTPAGNFTLSIAFLGQDGYAASQDVVQVEIIGINTEIVAEPTITVKVKDLNNTAFNLTLIDENGNVLANQTITIEFNGIVGDYVTDENGAISYALSEVPTAGNYTIVMNYAGAGNYTASEAVSTVVAVKEPLKPSRIFLRNALYFVTQNKIVNVTLWDADSNPIVGKKVSITMYNSTWSGITDETGTAHIRVGIGFGVHDAVVHFDGDDEYSASNRSGYVRVIKETPSVMVRGADARFKVTDPVKTVKVYLWDRTSKPLPVGSKIVLKINGQTYVGFTDSEGIARMNIDINKVGTFNAEVKYGGNTAYNAVTRIVKFVIQ